MDKLKIVVTILLILCFFVVGKMLWKVLTTERPTEKLPVWQELKIKEYQKKHKIHPQVIEIHDNGRMFYELNGRRCEIK